MNVNKTIENLIGLKFEYDDVICACESEEEIIVSEQIGRFEDFQIYENNIDSPIICIKLDKDIIVDAWKA